MVKNKIAVCAVRILIEMINPVGIKKRGPALNAMNLIPFFKEKFGKIRSILPGNSGN